MGQETKLISVAHPLPPLPQINCMCAAMGRGAEVVAKLVLTKEVAPHLITRDREVSAGAEAYLLSCRLLPRPATGTHLIKHAAEITSLACMSACLPTCLPACLLTRRR